MMMIIVVVTVIFKINITQQIIIILKITIPIENKAIYMSLHSNKNNKNNKNKHCKVKI